MNSKRRIKNSKFVFVAFTLLFSFATNASAQPAKKVFRIGYLSRGDPANDNESAREEGIRSALRDIGYIEGQNIAIDYRYAKGSSDLAVKFVAELVHLKVDIIVVAAGLRTMQATKNATKTIPIVMTGEGLDPVKAGLVENLGRPGGNITGLTYLSGQLGGKRLELLKDTIPKLTRVAILYDAASAGALVELKEILPASARGLGLSLQRWEVHSAGEFDRVFDAMTKQRPDGLYVPVGPLMFDHGKRVASLALKSRLPSMHNYRADVDAGGLMYYGADLAESYRRVAYYVDKILKGAKPGDLPVEQPTKFELAINLKTAKAIGVTIPQSMLYRADRVIK